MSTSTKGRIALKNETMNLQPGRPKVAVPIIAEQPSEIVAECERIRELPCDIIEWRADYYFSKIENLNEHLTDKNAYLDLVKILDDLNYIADGKPIIFTVRSRRQGGQIQVTREQLESIYGLVAQTELADFVDIELYDKDKKLHEGWLRRQIDEIHRHGTRVILSHHDFDSMPRPEKLVELVTTMYRMGADICKVAAMAYDRKDAETLLKATAYLTRNDIGPLIMIAMGEAGKSTRVAGGKYGSCITFAVGSGESAPGQVDTHTMKKWLDEYYGGQEG